jgi:hypothetical protein
LNLLKPTECRMDSFPIYTEPPQREAIEQTEQEPVACERCEELGHDKARYFRLYEQACIELQQIKKQEAAAEIKISYSDLEGEVIEILSCELDAGTYELYTTPQPPAQPLTDEQVIKLAQEWPADETNDWASYLDFARAIEAAHGITRGSSK